MKCCSMEATKAFGRRTYEKLKLTNTERSTIFVCIACVGNGGGFMVVTYFN